MHLPSAEAGLVALDGLARETARSLRGTDCAGAPEIHAERPVPSLDFNAVGLLYFPTFSRIAETAAFAHTGQCAPILGREVFYRGNINPGETVHVFDRGTTMLMARQDGAPIALVRTLTAPA